MTVDKNELRMLAEAATHKEWYAGNAYDKPFILKYQIITDTPDGKYVLLDGNQNFPDDCAANVAFVGAANPSTIFALLDELEQMTNNRDMWREQCRSQSVALHEVRANEKQAMAYLHDIREIVGGHDYPEMIQRIRMITEAMK